MLIQASLKVMPSGANQKEVYDKVNEVIEMIDNSNLKYQVGSSETTVEGEYKDIFNLVEAIHTKLVDDQLRQITMIIITDYNVENTYIEGKLENVNNYLNRGVSDEN
ncbi:YkoF family thiamine/hydroxymethylpyrimidine-binding protein [Mollicutes bacterium LVI A0039]|nr:YkoF family thiamine/hydroxymethylpyrimidine-binding protein [Mollicutes bacterium LVI A0039]